MDIFSIEGWYFLLRWFHFLAGITWIGMLYYFNLVQTPFFGTELGGTARSAMVRGLVPNALWWFRWGAMFTFLTGWLIILTKLGHDHVAARQRLHDADPHRRSARHADVGERLVRDLARAAGRDRQRDQRRRGRHGRSRRPRRAARAPGMASRTNTLFSIPMLFFMGAASHFTALGRRHAASAPTGSARCS